MPVISADANMRAAVGVPYLFNATGAVVATGVPPLTFSTCGQPPAGLRVDAASGAVRWTPQVAGGAVVCLQAQDAEGASTYTFDVRVDASAPAGPTARAFAKPAQGAAPLSAVLDASESSASSLEALPLRFLWSAGDGSAPVAEPRAVPSYRLPGGYVARVRVTDGYGTAAEAAVPVAVLDAEGKRPPSARIVAVSTPQADGSLDVAFRCDCAEGDDDVVAYRWELGNGNGSSTAEASARYLPGRYHATLTVVDAGGRAAWDAVEVVVRGADGREPPECRAVPSVTGGVAPLDVTWAAHAVAPAGAVAQVQWSLDGATPVTGRSVQARYANAGWTKAELVVVDDAGLRCTDQVRLPVAAAASHVPPQILSAPNYTARCGEGWQYSPSGPRPLALGSGELTWSLPQKPDRLELKEDGELRWFPKPAERGVQKVLLRVQGPGGSADQHFTVTVDCPDALDFTTEGCAASGAALAAPALLLLAGLHRRRRRG
jgi:uncharacterized protein (TIGR03382 family)